MANTPYVPVFTEKEIVKETVTGGVLDLPAPGTKMIARMGETAIHFTLPDEQIHTSGKLFVGKIDGGGFAGFRDINFWLDVPWEYEIVAEPETPDAAE